MAQESGKININSASEQELEKIPGIGSEFAHEIIEFRNMHGGHIDSFEELDKIGQIGGKRIQDFKDNMTL